MLNENLQIKNSKMKFPSNEETILFCNIWVRRKNVYCSYSTLSTTIIITVLTESCSLQNKVKQHVHRIVPESANIIHYFS